jgi:hypothetical protein
LLDEALPDEDDDVEGELDQVDASERPADCPP